MDAGDRRRLEALLDEYGEVADFEFQFRRRDGEIRIAHLSAFVTRDAGGSPIAHQGFVLDVTERKHAEGEIRRRNQELLALNAIGELLRQSKLGDGLAEALRKLTELASLDVAAIYLFNESCEIPATRRVCGPVGRSIPSFRPNRNPGGAIRPVAPNSSHAFARFGGGSPRGSPIDPAAGAHSSRVT